MKATHVLIVGMTGSGKSTLAKRMSNTYLKRGVDVLVYDPLEYRDWATGTQTSKDGKLYYFSSEEKFLDWFWKKKNCAVFIDEAGDTVGQHNLAMRETATKGRHRIHACHFITQRSSQLNPTVRGQCTDLYQFRTGRKDAMISAEEWNCDELAMATKLNLGRYIRVDRGGRIRRGNAFIGHRTN